MADTRRWPQLATDRLDGPILYEQYWRWSAARKLGITATDARRLLLASGSPSSQRATIIKEKLAPDKKLSRREFTHGHDRERVLGRWVQTRFGIRPNQALLVGADFRHLATPDGIGENRELAEIKTSVKPLPATLRQHFDQVQWQMHVTGAERVLFVVERSRWADEAADEPEHVWVLRDEQRIALLVRAADQLLEELAAIRAGDAPPPVGGYIYGLSCRCHPEHGIRYIGKSETAIERRLKGHLADAADPAKPKPAVQRWMLEHGLENIRTQLVEEVQVGVSLTTRETIWIARHRGSGDLLNATGGYMVDADGIWRRWSPSAGQPRVE